MKCNIDAKGKAARLITGILTVLVGLAVGLAVLLGAVTAWWVWIIAGLILAFGIFQL